jgi:hypothetical protein
MINPQRIVFGGAGKSGDGGHDGRPVEHPSSAAADAWDHAGGGFGAQAFHSAFPSVSEPWRGFGCGQ